MKLNIKKIRAKNFLSIGAIPIEYEYREGNHVVIGENGTGKTTLFIDAIVFAFKGISIRKVNKDGMINSINEKECEITCWFELNGVNYRIERGLKPGYLRFINEDDITPITEKSSVRDPQVDIDTKLGISTTSFINIVTLNIIYSQPFFRLPAADRREIILDVCNISIFGKMLEKARQDYNAAKSDLKVLISELKAAEENYKSKIDTYNKIKKYQETFEDSKQKEINSLQNRINESKDSLALLEKEKVKVNFIELLENCNNSKQKIQKMSYEVQSHMESNILIISKNKKKISKIKSNPICSECNSPTTEGHALVHIHELEQEMKKAEEENISNKDLLVKMSAKEKDIEQKRLKIQKSYEAETNNIAEIKNLHKVVEKLESEIETQKNKTFDLKEVVTDADLDKALLRVTVKKEEITHKEKEMRLADITKDRLGDKGVKSFSIKNIIPILNKTMNEYLSIFNATYNISFDNELNETLKSRRRDVFSYNNFSAGEQKRIDLALMFSLLTIAKKKNSINCNILILDEILDSSIESKGTYNLISFVKTALKKNFPGLCLYVISHRTEISEDSFDTIIKLKKDGDFTKIDEIQECEPTIQV